MTLKNVLEVIRNQPDQWINNFDADDVLQAEIDLLLHLVNNMQLEGKSERILQQASHVLGVSRQKEVSFPKQCLAQFCVALARLESEQVPYIQIKSILKKTILNLIRSTDSDRELLRMCLHNLAVVNYIEICEFNDKGVGQSQILEDLDKVEAQKEANRQKDQKLNQEMEIQIREQKFKQRKLLVRDKVREQLKLIKKRDSGQDVSQNKIQRARSKYESLLYKLASRISLNQLSKDKRYQKMMNQQDSESKEDRLRRSSRLGNKKVIDLLQGTLLQQPVQDVVKFQQPDFNLKQRSGNQILPKQTLEAFYQALICGQLKSINCVTDQLDRQFNEVMILLQLSLKLEDDQTEPLLYQTTEMIARLYTLDSRKYQQHADYWLDTAQKIALEMPDEQNAIRCIKRIQSLRCAYLIDQGQIDQAKEILDAFFDGEFTEEERDVEILCLTLSGIINQNIKHTDRAKELSQGYSPWLERRKWLMIPKITF